MDISPQKIAGTCNLKCAYSFKYQKSKSVATNYGTKIVLTYEVGTNPPATFNNIKYKVDQIIITCPSLHLFNSAKADAEIMIVHTPVSVGNQLYVCIPINTSAPTTSGSTIITEIISAVAVGAPTQGERTSQGISEFTLDNIIPRVPFYTYSAANIDFIVYGILNAISISTDTLTKLTNILAPLPQISFPGGPLLFLNPNGPTMGEGDGEIYIDCSPTGNSEEEINVTNVNVKSQTQNDLGTILSSPVFTILISSVLFVVVILLIYKMLMYMTDDKS